MDLPDFDTDPLGPAPNIGLEQVSGDDVIDWAGAVAGHVLFNMLSRPPTTSTTSQPNLPQSVAVRGPFVSPGSYTLTLDVDGRQMSQTVQVLGDPQMNLTAAQWRAREEFLVAVNRAQQRLHEALQAVSDGVQDSSAANGLRSRLQRLRGQLAGLAGQFNGRGVRQGSLYPPTNTHRERWRRLSSELEEALRDAQTAGGEPKNTE